MARTADTFISTALLCVSAGCFLFGAGVTVGDVLLRSTLGLNIPAAIELTSFSIGLGALVSMPVCYAKRAHVTARLLSEIYPGRFARPFGLVGTVASIIFAGILLAVLAENTYSKLGSPEVSRDLGLPMPILLGVVTATLAAAFLAALAGFLSELNRARRC